MILRAFATITAAQTNLRLLIVGDGPEMSTLRTLSQELNVAKKVIFAGFQSPANDYMALMQLFLLPSLSEGTSMTLLEAMSLGIPCVVSNVGGNPEVIENNKNGIVLAENTELHLATAIMNYLADKNGIEQASREAKRRFQQLFSAEKMLTEFSKIYQQRT